MKTKNSPNKMTPDFVINYELESFEFPNPIRPINAKRVSELVAIFSSGGCLRDQFPIPVVASSDADFQQLQELHRLSPPNSPLQTRVQGLKGQHRIAAAKAFLVGTDRWWPVAVYRELTGSQKRSIVEGRNYSIQYTDGQILRQILQGTNIGRVGWLGKTPKSSNV